MKENLNFNDFRESLTSDPEFREKFYSMTDISDKSRQRDPSAPYFLATTEILEKYHNFLLDNFDIKPKKIK